MLFTVNCSEAVVEKTSIADADQQIALKVEGMVCAVGCAKYIEKEVAKMAGVADCEVDFENETAEISFSSESMTEQEIVEAINGLNNGQYKVSVVDLNSVKEKTESVPEQDVKETPSVTEVAFRFPELITYFISRLAQ